MSLRYVFLFSSSQDCRNGTCVSYQVYTCVVNRMNPGKVVKLHLTSRLWQNNLGKVINYICFVLFCFVLLCFALLCFALLCFALLCFVLFCFALLCFALFCFALLCFALFCFVLFCFVLFCFLVVCLFDPIHVVHALNV